jgi:hypothetical protein
VCSNYRYRFTHAIVVVGSRNLQSVTASAELVAFVVMPHVGMSYFPDILKGRRSIVGLRIMLQWKGGNNMHICLSRFKECVDVLQSRLIDGLALKRGLSNHCGENELLGCVIHKRFCKDVELTEFGILAAIVLWIGTLDWECVVLLSSSVSVITCHDHGALT